MLPCLREHTGAEVDEVLRKKAEFEKDLANRWETERLDAILCPAAVDCAFKRDDEVNFLTNEGAYCSLWNLVHYPAGVVPITEVTREEELTEYTDRFNDPITWQIQESIKGSMGMPVGVQIVTR